MEVTRPSNVGIYPADDGTEIHCAGLSRYLVTILKDRQGWNTAYAELSRNVLFLLGVQFSEPNPRFELCGGLFVEGCHHHTGSTPRCPKVDHHRYVAALNLFFETGAIQLDWVSREKPIFTVTAAPSLIQFGDGYSIDCSAMRADDV